ncbi:hypothetical protein [Photorhabdus heterorhabditis]|uniref:AMP-dependent synthetase/ligase domain-containing protein n=1 Tax=Photorhabdus heterorhabditis TaxID=880156 RepID=A0A5B0VX82_9GAMM|nr:hypothetical protein [Photorhabdus heterorhabditis]KAA1179008.1 hypothetical protein F0L16_18455 [Photorhabdus heterorhabditis]KOY62118.1 hypothetical protein AM629_10340 [Photorhabdus heterorhabditis]MBS9443185.1 hypothetical protein [Photorhabdus heterorhabditis]
MLSTDGGIYFSTGGTTSKGKNVFHSWSQFNFVNQIAAMKMKPYFDKLGIKKVANCLTSGNLWGGFLFGHEICRYNNLSSFPFCSHVDHDTLLNYISEYDIDTLFCLPSFASKLYFECNDNRLFKIKNIFYLGEKFSEYNRNKIKLKVPDITIIPLAYTTQETGVIGYQCSHCNDDNYHLFEHIDVDLNSGSKEILVSVNYPDGKKVDKHNTGDIGELSKLICQCGFSGTNIILKGRNNHSSVILGTTISIDEFIECISSSLKNSYSVDPDSLQIISLENANGTISVFVIILLELFHMVDNWNKRLHNSTLISEIINDSASFTVIGCSYKDFLLTKISEKKKHFHITNNDSQLTKLKSENTFIELKK